MDRHSKLYFSKYSHTVQKEDKIAYYHSLRMRPVFADERMHTLIQKLHETTNVNEIGNGIADSDHKENFFQIVDALIENKVLSEDKNVDEKVITVFRNSLPKSYIKTVFFIMTDNCNFDCSYCFVKKELAAKGKTPTYMNEEIASKSLAFWASLTQLEESRFDEEKQIVFYGGEPLLNYKIIKFILEEIKKYQDKGKLTKNIKANIITNASLITPEIAEDLKKHKIGVSISIDGSEESTDSSRCYTNGKAVYGDIRQGMEYCHEAGLPFGISVTLNEKSLDNPQETEEIVYKTGAISLGLNPILQTDSSLKLPDDYAEKAADFILSSFKRYRKDGISEDRMMRKATAFANSNIYPFDCEAAGGNQIVISPEGKVGICHGLLNAGDYIVADVDDKTFSPVTNNVYTEWSQRSPLNIEECQECIALGICGGGCPFVAERETGSIWGLDKQFCVHAKKTTEWLIFDLLEQSQQS